jgi:hypothetical protein
MAPTKLLKLMLLAAPFEAAAALVIGSLGLQPSLLPAMFFLAYLVLQLLLGARYPGQTQAFRVTLPFVLVTLWAVASSYILPRLFEGAVFVWPQKASPPFVLALLEPSPSNINQDFYLMIDCTILVATAIYLTRPQVLLPPFIRIYFISGFVVAFISVWQLGSRLAGIPYPDDLLYSNPGWAILTAQQIGNVPRINGPFSEPSSLAAYMASLVCATGWLQLQGHRDRMARWLFITGLLTMMISTSTTGFAVLAMVGVGVPIYALVSGSASMLARILKIGVPLVLLCVLVSVCASIFVPQFNKNAAEVLDATLNKQGSSSYEDRTGADADSLKAAVDTYGLGTGWGSNRSSSLVPGLLAAIGVPGCIGLVWFGVGLARRVRLARKRHCSRDQLFVIDSCCGALVGTMLTAVISAPTITSTTFFFLLGLLIASVVRAAREAKTSLVHTSGYKSVPRRARVAARSPAAAPVTVPYSRL